MGTKAQKVFDEVGYNISQEAKDLITSLDYITIESAPISSEATDELERKLAEAEKREKKLVEDLKAAEALIAELKQSLESERDTLVLNVPDESDGSNDE